MPFSNNNVLKVHQVKALKKRNAYRKANVILRAETPGMEDKRESVEPESPKAEAKFD